MEESLEKRISFKNGKAYIKGTNITVEKILELLGEGKTFDDILKMYPELERDDIKAALLFAKETIEELIDSGYIPI